MELPYSIPKYAMSSCNIPNNWQEKMSSCVIVRITRKNWTEIPSWLTPKCKISVTINWTFVAVGKNTL